MNNLEPQNGVISSHIFLNDLLCIEELKKTKIRLNKYAGSDDYGRRPNFLEYFHDDKAKLMEGNFWNYEKKKSYSMDDIVIGFAEIEKGKYLLFDISIVTKDLNKLNAVGYEYKKIDKYEKYFGRVVVRYHNKSQNLVRRAESLIHEMEVESILPDVYSNDVFPGYENVNISWNELKRNINKESWKTALKNQKGVYLISDTKTGKFYIGSAYGKEMLLNRWNSYLKTGHGGNAELKSLNFDYVKENFHYSILEIYKSTVDNETVIKRESWWKQILLSREFGYNKN